MFSSQFWGGGGAGLGGAPEVFFSWRAADFYADPGELDQLLSAIADGATAPPREVL